jgi:hypothetical protein
VAIPLGDREGLTSLRKFEFPPLREVERRGTVRVFALEDTPPAAQPGRGNVPPWQRRSTLKSSVEAMRAGKVTPVEDMLADMKQVVAGKQDR